MTDGPTLRNLNLRNPEAIMDRLRDHERTVHMRANETHDYGEPVRVPIVDGRSEAAMSDGPTIEGIKAGRDEVLEDVAHGPGLHQPLLQRDTTHELHGDEHTVVDPTDLMYLYDVGVG